MDKTEDSDTLTHPMLYRQTMNSPRETSKSHKNEKGQAFESTQKDKEGWMPPIRRASQDENEECWDCYPNLARKIENQGTPEQVEQLHELQQAHSPKH